MIAGGPVPKNGSIAEIASGCDRIWCADSGADTSLGYGIIPDRVFGDLDSISPEASEIIKKRNIPVETYPVEKDMTDTEIVLRSVPKEDEVILICSLAGRIDHVAANLMLLMKLHEEGYDITATDGVSDVIPLIGEESLETVGLCDPESLNISLIPLDMDREAEGVTTEGLYYKLDNARLSAGSTYSVSNRVEDGKDGFKISIKKGRVLLMLTRENETF